MNELSGILIENVAIVNFFSFFAYDREEIGKIDFHVILLLRRREKKKDIVIAGRVAFAGSAQQRTRRRLVCPARW